MRASISRTSDLSLSRYSIDICSTFDRNAHILTLYFLDRDLSNLNRVERVTLLSSLRVKILYILDMTLDPTEHSRITCRIGSAGGITSICLSNRYSPDRNIIHNFSHKLGPKPILVINFTPC